MLMKHCLCTIAGVVVSICSYSSNDTSPLWHVQEGQKGSSSALRVASHSLHDTSFTAVLDGDAVTVQWSQHTQVPAT